MHNHSRSTSSLSDECLVSELEKLNEDFMKRWHKYGQKRIRIFSKIRKLCGDVKAAPGQNPYYEFEAQLKQKWHHTWLNIRGHKWNQVAPKKRQLIEQLNTLLDELESLGPAPTYASEYLAHAPLGYDHKKIVSWARGWNLLKGFDGRVSSLLGRLEGIIKNYFDAKNYRECINFLREYHKSKSPDVTFPLVSYLTIYEPYLLFTRGKPPYDMLDFSSLERKGSGKSLSYALLFADKIIRSLDAFEQYHPFLYLTGKFYRDHVFHALRTAWLIKRLAGKWQWIYRDSVKKTLMGIVEGCTSRYFSADDVKAAVTRMEIGPPFIEAMQAALFHDIYYPLSGLLGGTRASASLMDSLDSLNRLTSQLLENGHMRGKLALELRQLGRGVSCSIDRVVSSYLRTVDDLMGKEKVIPRKRLVKDWHDHGVLAGLLLNHFSTEVRQAMALHNLTDLKIDILKSPLAFFLVVCDVMQEWGRLLQDDQGKYFIPLSRIDWHLNEKELGVIIDFTKSKVDIQSRKQDFDRQKIAQDKWKNLRRLHIPKELGLHIEFDVTGLDGSDSIVFDGQKWCHERTSCLI